MSRKYDWTSWLGGGKFVIQRGTHYTCSQSAMSQQLRNAARRLGYSVHITDFGDGLSVTTERVKQCPDPRAWSTDQ